MTAVFERTVTRPALSDMFYIELDRGYGLGSSGDDHFYEGDGIISITYKELIQPQEIKDRKEELQSIRPDLVAYLWPSEDECLLDIIIDPTHPLYISGKPVLYNPFTLTYTEVWTFEDLAHLETFYNYVIEEDPVGIAETRAQISASNNTVHEKVYVDGVEVTPTFLNTMFA